METQTSPRRPQQAPLPATRVLLTVPDLSQAARLRAWRRQTLSTLSAAAMSRHTMGIMAGFALAVSIVWMITLISAPQGGVEIVAPPEVSLPTAGDLAGPPLWEGDSLSTPALDQPVAEDMPLSQSPAGHGPDAVAPLDAPRAAAESAESGPRFELDLSATNSPAQLEASTDPSTPPTAPAQPTAVTASNQPAYQPLHYVPVAHPLAPAVVHPSSPLPVDPNPPKRNPYYYQSPAGQALNLPERVGNRAKDPVRTARRLPPVDAAPAAAANSAHARLEGQIISNSQPQGRL